MAEHVETLQYNELAVLGNILSDSTGNQILTAVQYLTADDFTDTRNQAVFHAMLEINSKGQTPDLATVIDTLKNNKVFDAIGGLDYLNTIIENGAHVGSLEVYISRMKDRTLMDNFVGTLRDIYESATTKPIPDVSEFIGDAEKRINEISSKRSIKEAKRLGEISPSLVKRWVEQSKDFREKGIQPNGITGIPTGYEELDKLTKGWHKGHLILIGARPSVGKTAFALNLLYKVALQGTPVIFFSLEMDSESIEMRLLELASNLTSTEINSLDFAPDSTAEKLIVNPKNQQEAANVNKLQQGLATLAKLPFYVDENPGTNMRDIASRCKKLINGQNIKAGVIAIDYLGLIRPSKTSSNDNRTNQVAEISRDLKQLARDLKIPVIALSQLSRDSAKRGMDHRPQLTDLRDSGSLEQDADMVFFLYRSDYFKDDQKDGEKDDMPQHRDDENSATSQVQLLLQKNRDGSLGSIDFVFDKEHCCFNVAYDAGDNNPY